MDRPARSTRHTEKLLLRCRRLQKKNCCSTVAAAQRSSFPVALTTNMSWPRPAQVAHTLHKESAPSHILAVLDTSSCFTAKAPPATFARRGRTHLGRIHVTAHMHEPPSKGTSWSMSEMHSRTSEGNEASIGGAGRRTCESGQNDSVWRMGWGRQATRHRHRKHRTPERLRGTIWSPIYPE